MPVELKKSHINRDHKNGNNLKGHNIYSHDSNKGSPTNKIVRLFAMITTMTLVFFMAKFYL